QRPTQFGHLGDERRASYAYSHSNMPCGHRRDERRVTGDAQLTAAVEVDEQQTHTGRADDIAERVEEVVAGDIVEDHGVVVGPTDKARRATPVRDVHTAAARGVEFGTARGDEKSRGGFDQGAR